MFRSVIHVSSDDLLNELKLNISFFLFSPTPLYLLFLIPTTSSSSCVQPFVIHDMKSLMEGEQFINCRQIPLQERQQQPSILSAGHGGLYEVILFVIMWKL